MIFSQIGASSQDKGDIQAVLDQMLPHSWTVVYGPSGLRARSPDIKTIETILRVLVKNQMYQNSMPSLVQPK